MKIPYFVPAIAAIFVLQAIVFGLFLIYIQKRYRFIFGRINELKGSLSSLREDRIAPIEEKSNKLMALHEIEVRKLCRASIAIPPRFVAQYGEDLLIYEFFKNDAPGFFVEAGAYDGVFASNTLLLESLGWRGLLVEPHPGMAALCRKQRPNSTVAEVALGPADAEGMIDFTCADDSRGGAALSFLEADPEHIARCQQEGCLLTKVTVPFKALTQVLAPLAEKVDLLSLDIEGMELSVLEGFDFRRYRPRMIIVEWQNDSRDEAVRAYLELARYQLLAKRNCNAFYLVEEDADSFQKVLGKYPLWRVAI